MFNGLTLKWSISRAVSLWNDGISPIPISPTSDKSNYGLEVVFCEFSCIPIRFNYNLFTINSSHGTIKILPKKYLFLESSHFPLLFCLKSFPNNNYFSNVNINARTKSHCRPHTRKEFLSRWAVIQIIEVFE